MNQSTVIFGFLAAAFVIFITQRGELPIYAGFLLATPKKPSSGPTASPTGAISVGDAATTAATVSDLASLLPFGVA